MVGILRAGIACAFLFLVAWVSGHGVFVYAGLLELVVDLAQWRWEWVMVHG